MNIPTLEIALISLLIIISLVGVVVRYLKLPYPVALVITGLTLGVLLRGPLPGLHDLQIEEIRLTPDLILFLLLPALLFEATLHIEARALRETLVPIGVLAIPGVVLTAGIVGTLVHWGIQLDWPVALFFGAIVAATDPIAVLAIFKRLGAPHSLELLVEGESLFNDGTAVVLARILQGVVMAGSFNVTAGIVNFAIVVGGGLLVGGITGLGMARLTSQIDDHLIEITFTTILAYGTFFVAETMHVSGVIAVVTAGLVFGNIGTQQGMSPTTRLSLLNFWEYLAFLINSVIFLLIGLQVNLRSLATNFLPITIAIGAVLLARGVVVYGFGLAVLPLPRVLPLRWLHTLFWAGLRGAVSLAVALSIPFDFPERALLLDLTFGVVLFTLLVQGLTMEPLLRYLKLVGSDEHHRTYASHRAQLYMLRAGQRELQRLAGDTIISPRVYTQLDEAYRASRDQMNAAIDDLYQHQETLEAEELQKTRAHLLRVERTALENLQRQGLIDNDTAQKLAEDVNKQLIDLQSRNDESQIDPPVVDTQESSDDPTVGDDTLEAPTLNRTVPGGE